MPDEGLKNIIDGVEKHTKLGAYTFLPLAQSILGIAYTHTSSVEKAREILLTAIELTNTTNQFWLLPELRRLLAMTYLLDGNYVRALSSFEIAWNSANNLGSYLWRIKILKSFSKHEEFLDFHREIYINKLNELIHLSEGSKDSDCYLGNSEKAYISELKSNL